MEEKNKTPLEGPRYHSLVANISTVSPPLTAAELGLELGRLGRQILDIGNEAVDQLKVLVRSAVGRQHSLVYDGVWRDLDLELVCLFLAL